MFSHVITDIILHDGTLQTGLLDGAGSYAVVLHLGNRGVLVADANGCRHSPPVSVDVVDPIGAGNAFTSGFLVGYCETRDIRTAGKWGSGSASYVIRQYGPPPLIAMIEQQARRLAESVKATPIEFV